MEVKFANSATKHCVSKQEILKIIKQKLAIKLENLEKIWIKLPGLVMEILAKRLKLLRSTLLPTIT